MRSGRSRRTVTKKTETQSKTEANKKPKPRAKSAKKSAAKSRSLPSSKKRSDRPSKKEAKPQTRRGITPVSLGLLVLSPLRFPLDVEKVAIQTASFFGMFFVLSGALLTLWHASTSVMAVGTLGVLGQVINSSLSTNTTSQDTVSNNSSSETLYHDAASKYNFDPDPINTALPVRLRIKVPAQPQRAYLFAKNIDTRENYAFGNFTRLGDDMIETFPDMGSLPSGTYQFHSVLTYRQSSGGTYSIVIKDSITRTVTAPESQAATLSDDTASTTATTTPERFPPIDPLVEPTITFDLPDQPLRGLVPIQIETEQAAYMELYIVPLATGIQRYLGLPRKISDTVWRFPLNTVDIPNGRYRFVLTVRTPYGFFTKRTEDVLISNDLSILTDPAAIDYRENALDVETETRLDLSFLSPNELSEQIGHTPEEQLDALIEAQAGLPGTPATTSADHETRFNEQLEEQRSDLESALQILAVAKRSQDEEQIALATEYINTIRAAMLDGDESFAEFVNDRISDFITRIETDIERTDRIITERTGVAAQTDTDRDGITDFDEVVIYQTDPHVADSDGDGFNDGTEILSGHDPIDSTPEAKVAYESPRESGLIREDLLSVDTIKNLELEDEDDTTPVAVFTGRGLPNSFVTLYVFSTPIIVTVRTDSDGSWIYRFDKELEDGLHQIYVGITDNAGKIVAKSSPLPFVKTANAYELAAAPAPGVMDQDASGTTRLDPTISLVLVVASISVVAIGLVLILIGMHIDNRRKTLDLKTGAPL